MGRFKHLVDSEEGMKSFRAKYNIPPHVGIRYAAQREWFDESVRNRASGPLYDVGPNPREWVESYCCLSKWRFDWLYFSP